MTISASNVTVGDTEVSLHAAAATAEEVHIKPLHNSKVYIGPTGVTPATGYPVQGEFKYTTLAIADEVFAITDGPTAIVALFKNVA